MFILLYYRVNREESTQRLGSHDVNPTQALFSTRPGSLPNLEKFQWLGSFSFLLVQYHTIHRFTPYYQVSFVPHLVFLVFDYITSSVAVRNMIEDYTANFKSF